MQNSKIFLCASVAAMGLLLGCGGRDKSEGLGLLLTRTSPLLGGEERHTWDDLKLRFDCSQGGIREEARRLDDLSFGLKGGRNAEGRLEGTLETESERGLVPTSAYIGYASGTLDLIYIQAIPSGGQNISYNVILSLCNYNEINEVTRNIERLISDSSGELHSFRLFNAEVANASREVKSANLQFVSMPGKPQDRYFQSLPTIR